jgi:hypothetical protein
VLHLIRLFPAAVAVGAFAAAATASGFTVAAVGSEDLAHFLQQTVKRKGEGQEDNGEE